MKEMDEIVLCPKCGKYEYRGRMKCAGNSTLCRNCYKEYYLAEFGKSYPFEDLKGYVPTLLDYISQDGFI